MIHGFDDTTKEKVQVVPLGGYVGRFSDNTKWAGHVIKTGDGYFEATAPADGMVWGSVDATVSGASIQSSYGIYVAFYINNVLIGHFHSDSNTKTWTTPSFPVKAGDVVKIQNGYTENTIGIGLRGVEMSK